MTHHFRLAPMTLDVLVLTLVLLLVPVALSPRPRRLCGSD